MFWVQKVLPLAFDDALSYYESIAKMRHKLNETIEQMNKTGEAVEKLSEAYAELTEYVQKYFDELDLQPLMNEAINQSILNGQLQPVITSSLSHFYNPVFVNSTDDMINENYAYVLQYSENNNVKSDIYVWNPTSVNEDEAVLGGGQGPMEDPLTPNYMFSGYQFGGIVTNISDMSGPLTGFVLSSDNSFYFYSPQLQTFTKSDYLYGGIVTTLAQMAPINYIYVLKSNYHVYAWNGEKFDDTNVVYGIVASDPSVQDIINKWLNEHPEATTTVQDGSITTAKLANAAVTSDKIAPLSVTNFELAYNSVGDFNLKDQSVTTTKLADDSITTVKIADEAVDSRKIANNSILQQMISPSLAPLIYNSYVTPEMFGAKGDGITDDLHAIQLAVNTSAPGKPVIFSSKSYAIKGSINLKSNCQLIGFDTTLLAISTLSTSQRVLPIFIADSISDFKIKGFTLDLFNPNLPTVSNVAPKPFTNFYNSSNFTLSDIVALHFINDGSYSSTPIDPMSGTADGTYSSFCIHKCNNFELNHIVVTSTRRLGINISDSQYVKVSNCIVKPQQQHPDNEGYLTAFNLLYCEYVDVSNSIFQTESNTPNTYMPSTTCNCFANHVHFSDCTINCLTGTILTTLNRSPGALDFGHELIDHEPVSGWDDIKLSNCYITGGIIANFFTYPDNTSPAENFTNTNLYFVNCSFVKQFNNPGYHIRLQNGDAHFSNCSFNCYGWTIFIPFSPCDATFDNCSFLNTHGPVIFCYRDVSECYKFSNCYFASNHIIQPTNTSNSEDNTVLTQPHHYYFLNCHMETFWAQTNPSLFITHQNTHVWLNQCNVNTPATIRDNNIFIHSSNNYYNVRLATTHSPLYLYSNNDYCNGQGGILNLTFNEEHLTARDLIKGVVSNYLAKTDATIINGTNSPPANNTSKPLNVILSNVQKAKSTSIVPFPVSNDLESVLEFAPLYSFAYSPNNHALKFINNNRTLSTIGIIPPDNSFLYTMVYNDGAHASVIENDTTVPLPGIQFSVTQLFPSLYLFHASLNNTIYFHSSASIPVGISLFNKNHTAMTGAVIDFHYDSSTFESPVQAKYHDNRFSLTLQSDNSTIYMLPSDHSTVSLTNPSFSLLIYSSDNLQPDNP